MNKIYTIILAFLIPVLSFGGNDLPQLLAGKKICLDPGHGGHDGDDREIPIDFGLTYWESDGVFFQANYAAEILRNLGADVKVTRYTNDTHDENRQPSLSERVAMANAFEADFFQSIHTNGNNGTSNFVLTIYRGENQVPVSPEGKRMCDLMKDEIAEVINYNQTNIPVMKADRDMLPYHLGVLNGTTMPAMLSEAGYHDYKLEGRRLNNPQYQKSVAYTYVKSYLNFYDLGIMPVGEIGGRILFADDTEANEVKISLLKDGSVINSQYSDLGHNGYYFFDLLDEGDYSLKFEKNNFTTITKDNIQVVKGEYTQTDVKFETTPENITTNAPKLIFVGNTADNGVEAKWIKSDLDGLLGYRLYYSTDYTSWKLAADENVLNAESTSVILEKTTDYKESSANEAFYFKLVAVSSSVNSDESEIFVKKKLSGTKSVIIVDGYEAVFGDEDVDNAIALHYFEALSQNSDVKSIETVNSNRVYTANVDFNNYDIVVWVSSFESADDENFSGNERASIRPFLEKGGHLIVTGANVGYDLKLNGLRFSEQDFYTDILKSKYDVSNSKSRSVVGETGTFFDGVNFDFATTAEVLFTDAIKTWDGSEVLLKYGNDKIAAIGYRGGFASSIELGRLIYFAFPLETISQENLNTLFNKSFEYFGENVDAPAPPKPVETEIYFASSNSSNNGIKLEWKKSTSDYVTGYNLYYSENNGTNWKLVADYSVIDENQTSVDMKFSEFSEIPNTENDLSFKLIAVSSGNDQIVEGDDSKVFSIAKNTGNIEILVVDGFDRTGTGFDNTSANLINLQTQVFAENELTKSVSSCSNDAIISGKVNLNTYHAVFWILGEESTADESFSSIEQGKVKEFLENGGALFVSGAEIAWDLDNKGSSSDKDFINNYLKANYVSDGSSSYITATGISGTLFDGVSFDFSKLWKIGYPDVISANGSTVVSKYNGGVNSGIAYKGIFGSGTKNGGVVYLGFPIETADQADIKIVLDKTLEYFNELATDTAPVANNDNANTVEDKLVVIDVLANDVDNENNIDETTLAIETNVTNGTTEIIDSKINYTPSIGFIGEDTFTYTVKDFTGKVSGSANVTITVSEKSGLPYETEVDLDHPKRDLRATFLTTAYGIDWPGEGSPASWQINDLKKIIEGHYVGNANAFMFQVRPASDAFYNSNIEPWSKAITGTSGKDPGYDPLQIAIDESHVRGMELHAWLNPYRTRLKSDTYALAASHVENQHPEWIMVYEDGTRILNPGIPAVIDYIVSVVEDIVTNYDVDGIHFDDYFYAYGGTPAELDANEFSLYNPEGLGIDDWRRANINNMVKAVYDKIQDVNSAQNKNVIFGISPFGIWKSGVPSGIVGTSAYSSLYADALAWLQGGYVDYVSPQLYWRIGSSGQDYSLLSEWWNNQAEENGRFHIPAQAIYRMKDHSWPVSEIQNQIDINRQESYKNTLGQIFYASKYFSAPNDDDGYKSLRTRLLESQFKNPSVPATYVWKEKVVPNKPETLLYSGGELSWTKPSFAADSDTARKFIVYRFNSMEELITDKHNGRRIVAVTGTNSIVVPDSWLNYGENYLCVSAIDKNNNESDFSNVVVVDSRPEYCDAKGVISSTEWIEKVKFFELENISGNNNGYANFTNKIFQLRVGSDTEIVLTPGFSATALSQHWKVYIDYNNDGDFSDNDENVFATTSTSTSAVSETVSLPSSIKEGLFRMRIMMKGTTSSNDIDACTDIDKGEVEDYLVNLTRKDLANDDFVKDEIQGIAFPNPFVDNINFSLQSEKKENVEFVVYNFMGQIVYNRTFRKNVGGNSFSIKSSAWSQGVYLLLVRDENGKKKVYEIVKK